MADVVISLVLIAFSIGYMIVTASLPAAVAVTVGPKGFPYLVAALLIAASVVLLGRSIKAIARGGGRAIPRVPTPQRKNLVVVIAAAVGYVVVLKYVGYVLATFLFLATALVVWNRGRLLLNLSIAAGSAICAYVLISALQIALPGGLFGLP
jgi:putative tricarboxylic transport membrane protein